MSLSAIKKNIGQRACAVCIIAGQFLSGCHLFGQTRVILV
jgi:hypothetical protein